MGATALAIDFGSSNTAAAFRDADGHSHKIALSSEGFLMPSAVFYADGDVLVGRTAVQAATTRPDAFEASPKRRLGDEEIQLAGNTVAVPRLIAAVLTEVLDRSRRAMRAHPDEVILTHPDNWGPPRQGLLTDAGVAAGIDRGRIKLVSEATSAAWYYTVAASQLPVGARLAVFDFGAGTCDVAVLDKQPDESFSVVAADGIERLGGRDLDGRVEAWVRAQLAERDPALLDALDADVGLRLTLADRITEAKEALSDADSASIVVAGSTGGTVLQLTRAEFDTLIGPDIERAVVLTGNVLNGAEKRRPASSPVTIYLTGGSSAIPLVRSRLSALGAVGLLGDPKTVVAQGALLVPFSIEGADAETVVTDPRQMVAAARARSMASIPRLKLPPAGWYPDPRNPQSRRHWDGARWAAANVRSNQVPAAGRRQPPPSGPRMRPPPGDAVPAAAVEPNVPTKPRNLSPPLAPTEPGIPLSIAEAAKAPNPFGETQVAPLPIFPRSNPALSQPSLPVRSTVPEKQPTQPPEKPPEKPSGRTGLADRLPPAAQAVVSAALLVPTAALLLGFQQVGDASDFSVLWQWQPPSTAWFVAPYLYLIAAIVLFGRTPRARRDGALVAGAALILHMAGSYAAAEFTDSTLYLRLVYGAAGVVAVIAWALARRRYRSWTLGLLLAVPVMIGMRYVDQMVTIANITWIAVWIQYFGSFAVCSVVLWGAEQVGAPRVTKPPRRRR